MSIEIVRVKPDDGENRRFGDKESAVEYLNNRPHENFHVYGSEDLVAWIRGQANNVLN